MRIDSTDAVSLELHDFGGDGPPLLIGHATGFCGGTYRPLAKSLTDSFHVWALDFRSHGESTPPVSGDHNWQGMIDDALAAIEAIGEPVFGFGHSMGGASLLGAEARQPGVLKVAWVFEPIVTPPEWGESGGENPMSAAARRRRTTFESKGAALWRYSSKTPLGTLRADSLAAYIEAGFEEHEDGSITLRCDPADEGATFEAVGKPNFDDMAKVHVPVVVGYGTREPYGPQSFAPRVAEVLSNGSGHQYSHLGHFGPLEDPTTIANDAMHHFLSTVA